MPECRYFKYCPVFKRFETEGARNIYIHYYCKGPKMHECVRFLSAEEGGNVPSNLLPDGESISEFSDDKQSLFDVSKSIFRVFSILIIPAGLLWSLLYFINGIYRAAVYPFVYSLISTVFFILFVITKRYRIFLMIQLILMILLPYLVHSSFGGFQYSGCVLIWAVVSPIGAFLSFGRKTGFVFSGIFSVILIVSAFYQPSWLLVEKNLPVLLQNLIFSLNIIAVMMITFLVIDYFIRQLKNKQKQIQIEHDKAEKLLLNILPIPIAMKLRNSDKVAEKYDEVTVLFADLVGFTDYSSLNSPDEVVGVLDELFSDFDRITDCFGVEKIKTIGDAYMAVAGLPFPVDDHADRIADTALEMVRIINEKNYKLKVRIGINSGPVVAGVIGKKKFIYDLWGDTVNIASRMESHGDAGKICISENTYGYLKNRYDITEKGLVDVKGKGEMKLYYLNNSKK